MNALSFLHVNRQREPALTSAAVGSFNHWWWRGRISHPVAECALTTVNLFWCWSFPWEYFLLWFSQLWLLILSLGVFSLMVLSTLIADPFPWEYFLVWFSQLWLLILFLGSIFSYGSLNSDCWSFPWEYFLLWFPQLWSHLHSSVLPALLAYASTKN
jgi:hypothetical protein